MKAIKGRLNVHLYWVLGHTSRRPSVRSYM